MERGDEDVNRNRDKECEAVLDFCWDDGEGGERWWCNCSLCGRSMDVPPPSRCPSCGAKVVE